MIPILSINKCLATVSDHKEILSNVLATLCKLAVKGCLSFFISHTIQPPDCSPILITNAGDTFSLVRKEFGDSLTVLCKLCHFHCRTTLFS